LRARARRPSALVLAAGASTRFRGAKQLARLRGEPLVARAVEAIPPSRVGEVVVVVGHESAAVAKALGRRRVRLVENPDYRRGMASSIAKGVAALESGSPGVLLLLADQPFVSRGLVGRVLEAFEEGGGERLVAADYGGFVAPPAAFPRAYFGDLSGLRGDRGARSILDANASSLVRVRVRRRRAALDVDTKADLDEARRLLDG